MIAANGLVEGSGVAPRRWVRLLSLAMVLAACIYFAVWSARGANGAFAGEDFKAIYGASRCMIAGCNPYNSAETKLQFLQMGGTTGDVASFAAHYLGYPPNALFYVVPIAFFSWPVALQLWMWLSICIYVTAAFAITDLCLPYAPLFSVAELSLFVMTSLLLIMLGQPATLSIGLCCIAVWCFVRRRYQVAGVLCFAMSLVFKPHLAALVLVYFFLANATYRKRALQVLVVTILLSAPGLIWVSAAPQSRYWVADLRTNVTGVASHGDLSDPGPANPQAFALTHMQAVVSVFRDDKSFYNPVSQAICGLLLLAWIYPVLRLPDGLTKDFLCLAAVAPLAMLPIYHRVYDTRLLLLIFPASSLLLAVRRRIGVAALLFNLVLIAVTFAEMNGKAHQLIERVHPASSGRLGTVLFERPIPILCLICCLFYLACCYMLLWQIKHGKRVVLQ